MNQPAAWRRCSALGGMIVSIQPEAAMQLGGRASCPQGPHPGQVRLRRPEWEFAPRTLPPLVGRLVFPALIIPCQYRGLYRQCPAHGIATLYFIHLDFMTNVAAFDAGIVSWNEKAKWDAVRPFSAIRYLYGNRPVTAWGGPGKGTVQNLPASQWEEYLNLPDHPEYSSVSTAMCETQAQAR